MQQKATISIEKDLKFIQYLVKLKVIDDRIFRDIEIRREYRQLRKEARQPSEEIRRSLSEKYFLSDKSIQRILYESREDENTILLINLKPFKMTTITIEK
ncbi:MAG: hypothetical protein HXY50_00515 [Ignavibacteriaceae bacterium]|nr:hypothetical protein [Ignavibacteriaceae bacterium]